MKKENYSELMNSKPLLRLTPDFKGDIKFGTLIGFKGLGGDKGITAAYPVWSFKNDEIQFILFTKDNGQPCLDNTWLTSDDLYINEEPIIVKLTLARHPSTFNQEVVNFFNPTKKQKNMENQFFILKKDDGQFLPYGQSLADGYLRNIPVVYTSRQTANKKADFFNHNQEFKYNVVEVKPEYAILDEEKNPIVYFVTEREFLDNIGQAHVPVEFEIVRLN